MGAKSLDSIFISLLSRTASNVILQDSGGFQLVSLSKFTTITEEGALFASPFTGEPTMLSVRPLIKFQT